MKREHRKPWRIQELAFSGLFSALIAVGAFVKITIPVQPVPMQCTTLTAEVSL